MSPYPRLSTSTTWLLLVPPVVWAGNALLGHVAADWMPPVTLNFVRWLLAAVVLLPWGAWALHPRSPAWAQWKPLALLGFLGMACYNMLQYVALHTSSPLNVTLVASSTPVWMLLIGRLFFHTPITHRAWVGAALSVSGVLVVLSQGDWQRLWHLHLVPGDALMLLAAATWAAYSWLLTRPETGVGLRHDWAAFLLVQMVLGLVPAGVMTLGEWLWLMHARPDAVGDAIQWGWPLAGVLLYTALGPSLLAYRCWGLGVAAAGPTTAAFFANLTPALAAVGSLWFIDGHPQLYHLLAFALIVAGISWSSWQR